MLKKNIGQRGEQIAAKYYQKLGWQIIAKNFWTRYGELDLVLQKDKQILIVEVKTRSNQNFGWAEESIDEQKINRIQISYQFLQQKLSLPYFYQIEIFILEKKFNKYIIEIIKV